MDSSVYWLGSDVKFDDVLLALIARKPASGYDLGRWLATEGTFIRASADQSQIYKTLNRLVERAYIDFVVEKRDGAPDAKVYSLTRIGADRLFAVVDAGYVPPARWQEADFTAWYTLLGVIKPERIVSLIDAELAFRRQQVATYRNRPRSQVIQEGYVHFDREVMHELFDGMHQYNAAKMDEWLEWLEGMREHWLARYPADEK